MSRGPNGSEPVRLQVAVPADGARTHRRDAVRAIAVDPEGRHLLTEARSTGLKLPGGGVDGGESDEVALARELREETGYELARVDGLAIVVDEQRPGIEPGVVLEMQSRYYRVTLGHRGPASREEDEVALGLEATWLPLDEALRRQRIHVADDPQPWARRELAVLEWLARQAAVG